MVVAVCGEGRIIDPTYRIAKQATGRKRELAKAGLEGRRIIEVARHMTLGQDGEASCDTGLSNVVYVRVNQTCKR